MQLSREVLVVDGWEDEVRLTPVPTPTTITHLDLGCGPAGQRIAWLMRQGIDACLGVDLDLEPDNPDLVAGQGALSTIQERLVFLHDDYGLNGELASSPENTLVRLHLVQEDALEMLRRIQTGQLEAVYGDFFFCNLNHREILKNNAIYKEIRRALKKGGRLVITEENEDLDLMIDYMMSLGFRFVSAEREFELVTNDLRMRKVIDEIEEAGDIIQVIFEKQ